jgi:hypothetical protein
MVASSEGKLGRRITDPDTFLEKHSGKFLLYQRRAWPYEPANLLWREWLPNWHRTVITEQLPPLQGNGNIPIAPNKIVELQ